MKTPVFILTLNLKLWGFIDNMRLRIPGGAELLSWSSITCEQSEGLTVDVDVDRIVGGAVSLFRDMFLLTAGFGTFKCSFKQHRNDVSDVLGSSNRRTSG